MPRKSASLSAVELAHLKTIATIRNVRAHVVADGTFDGAEVEGLLSSLTLVPSKAAQSRGRSRYVSCVCT